MKHLIPSMCFNLTSTPARKQPVPGERKMAFLATRSEPRPNLWTHEREEPSLRGRCRRGLLTEGRGRAEVSGIWGWEFPCQWAHLTASLMDHGDVPQGPDGIQWSARWQLVKGGQASCIMEAQSTTPQADCCTDVEVVPPRCQYCRVTGILTAV